MGHKLYCEIGGPGAPCVCGAETPAKDYPAYDQIDAMLDARVAVVNPPPQPVADAGEGNDG